MLKTRFTLALLLVGFLTSCLSSQDEDDDIDWPEKGDMELEVLFSPKLENEEFYLAWQYPGAGDDFFFEENVNNGSSFKFIEKDFTLNYGYTQYVEVRPSWGPVDPSTDTKTCYDVTIVLKFAGREYDRRTWSVGENNEVELGCDVGGIYWFRSLPL